MILKKNLLKNVPVLDVCDEYNIHPTLFYRWQREFFEKGILLPKKLDRKIFIRHHILYEVVRITIK